MQRSIAKIWEGILPPFEHQVKLRICFSVTDIGAKPSMNLLCLARFLVKIFMITVLHEQISRLMFH